MSLRVAVIRTGTANLASVLAALTRAGATPFETLDPEVVASAERVVLPGVGAFGAAMGALVLRPERAAKVGMSADGLVRVRMPNAAPKPAKPIDPQALVQAIAERVRADRPLLGICLGLQLLCRASEESAGVRGIGAIEATVRRFGDDVLVPQLGWNMVRPVPGAKLLLEGYAYFANSYRLEAIPEGWSGAMSDHGGPFVAALERGAVLACQFHPELSGSFGHALIARWLGGP